MGWIIDQIPYSMVEGSITRETIINGQRTQYDFCGSGSRDESDKYYGEKYTYVGSSKVYFINGVENHSDTDIHFYKRKS